MTIFHLQLLANESTFEYSFSEEFLSKQYEIGLIKIDGELKINKNNTNSSINIVDINNNPTNKVYKHFENAKKVGDIFLNCNLIEDSYVNENKLNSIYRFKHDNKKINVEPRQIIYHKISSRPNKIILKLVDSNNNLIILSF